MKSYDDCISDGIYMGQVSREHKRTKPWGRISQDLSGVAKKFKVPVIDTRGYAWIRRLMRRFLWINVDWIELALSWIFSQLLLLYTAAFSRTRAKDGQKGRRRSCCCCSRKVDISHQRTGESNMKCKYAVLWTTASHFIPAFVLCFVIENVEKYYRCVVAT